jgi:hypothetical protein
MAAKQIAPLQLEALAVALQVREVLVIHLLFLLVDFLLLIILGEIVVLRQTT